MKLTFYGLMLLFSIDAFANLLELKIPVEKFKLNNGLTVLLHKDSNIPMVSYHTWYRVGSRDEKIGVTGAAHMLEHMMFKGAKKYNGKMFDQILHENGIQNNAFTTADFTGFYENLPSSKLELIMDMEVDRMQSLAINPDDLKSELQVVGEERRWRVDNNPVSLLREAMLGVLYQVHPYRWPVIGYMKDIQAYTSEKLRHFYETFYVPNNAVLVIAGDIDVEQTKELVKKHYGVLQKKELAEKKFPIEPELKSEKKVQIKGEVQNTTVIEAYRGVQTGHQDSYALDLVSNILGSGASSRIYKNLVYQKQKAVGASCYNNTSADPGYFFFVASLKPKMSSQFALDAFAEEVSKIKKSLISVDELEKAKNQVMKDYINELSTIDGKAQFLAITEIIRGDYQEMFNDLKKYDSVSVSDIHRVANKYLSNNRKVIAILNPKK